MRVDFSYISRGQSTSKTRTHILSMFLSFLLVLILVFLPTSLASAAEAGGYLTQSDIEDEFVIADRAFAEKYDDVISELRTKLTAHESTFSIDFLARENLNVDGNFIASIYYYAVEHNGNPCQGDYIRRQVQSFSWKPSSYSDTKGIHVVLDFTMQYYCTAAQEQQCEAKAAAIIEYLQLDEMSDYDKILAIYDYLCQNVAYDYDRLADPTDEIEHSAYAALCEGTSVCQGYATAFYKLALMAGLDCRVVTGEVGNEGHGWNLVKLGEEYYLLDATFDAGKNEYRHFMKNEADFADHVPDTLFQSQEFKQAYPISASSLNVTASFRTVPLGDFLVRPSLDKIVIERYTGFNTHVVIPRKIDGVPVAGLSQGVFSDNDMIVSIEISDGVPYITSLMAVNCPNLNSIKVLGTSRYILQGYDTMGLVAGCDNLETIEIAGCIDLAVVDGILYNHEQTKIITCPAKLDKTSVTIPDGVERIEDGCFRGNKIIEEVNLPESINYIGAEAFRGTTNLKSVNLPAGVMCVGEFAFADSGLTSFTVPQDFQGEIREGVFYGSEVNVTVEQGNPYYIVYRNCFFRGTDVLYYVPVGSGNQCEIPKGATGILRYAFANTYNLTLVEIPEGVKTIGDHAFYYSNVFTLELPASLETIGEAAFDKSFLNQITLDPESKNFILLDDILYTKDKKELIVASGKEVCTVHVPEETEEIRSGAFQRKSFTAIQLPAGLKKLEKNALSNSHGKLSCKILFEGTEDAWTKIAPELTGLTVDDTIGQPGETGSAISGPSITYSFKPLDGDFSDHIGKVIPAIEGNCQKEGFSEGRCCAICGTVLEAQESTGLGQHQFAEGDITPPTCTEVGYCSGAKCTLCDQVMPEGTTIPALGHDPVTDVGYAPTCSKTGLTDGSHCARCNAVLVEQRIIPMEKHTPVTDKGYAATCTKTGLTDGSHCSVCNEVLVAQEIIPMKKHTPVTDKGYAATCTKTGLTDGSHCSVCNEVLVAQEIIPMKKHTPVTDKGYAATCTKAGLTDGSHCSVCKTVITAQKTIPALGHKTRIIPAKAATTKAAGYKKYSVCDRCGKELTKKVIIPKLLSKWQTINGKRYYYVNGKPVTGLKTISGKKYYFSPAKNTLGQMQTGLKNISGKKYYFSPAKKTLGQMQTGFKTVSKKTYYFTKSGAVTKKFKKIKNKWYYFDKNGVMATGKKKIGSKVYRFNSKGVCLNK